jgi:hypothetical protein
MPVSNRRPIGSAAAIAISSLLLSAPAAAVSLIDSKLPTAWEQSVTDVLKHYIETYSGYDDKRKEEARQQIIPKLVKDLVAISAGSEVLAAALANVSRGHEKPQRLALLAMKIHRSLESFVSTIRAIDPSWPGATKSTDFLKALDQLQNGKFDFVDGRIWELGSARDMKPDEARQLAFGLQIEAQQLIETVKRLIVETDAY